MKNKTVKMIFSIGVLAVLCGTYFGVKTYVAKQEESEEEEEEKTVTVFSSSLSDIQSLQFLIDKNEVIFDKDEDGVWLKQDESDFPVNQDKLNETAGALDNVVADRVLNDVEDLEEYGLDAPLNTIRVTTDEGETLLRVGMKNESTNQYYVDKDDDRTTVYVVNSSSLDPFMNSLYDYAQMEDFPAVTSSGVYGVQVEEDSSYKLEKDEDTGFWNISDENYFSEKADSAKANTLASSLSSIAYNEFVNYDADEEEMKEYGLDDPYAEILVDYTEEVEVEEDENSTDEGESSDDETEDGNETETVTVEKQLAVYVGNEAKDDTRYVRVNDSSAVYTISNETLDNFLDKTASDYWDMTVSYVSVNELDSLDVEYSGEIHEISVSRETSENEDGEEVENITYQVNGDDVDSTLFTTFYNKMINLAAQKRITEDTELPDGAEMSVTFHKIDGSQIGVKYYSYDTNFYAVVVDEKIYMVNKMTVKELMTAYEKLVSDSGDDGTDVDGAEADDVDNVDNVDNVSNEKQAEDEADDDLEMGDE